LNGARFLPSQLASFEQQEFQHWRVLASDDGSSDETNAILSVFQRKHGADKVDMKIGPRKGPVANFLSLACEKNLKDDYFAFSDQDDIWEPDKLTRAVGWLRNVPADIPALYCSRTRLIDAQGRAIGFSPFFQKKPTFCNALVQNIAGGNTMVFNQKARALLMRCGSNITVPVHDWWLYLITTAAGGQVYYDSYPSVRYRVHADNLIGSNAGWTSRMKRLRMLMGGRFREWIEKNVKALDQFRPHMTVENQKIFDLFCQARHQPLVQRAMGFARSGVYRQTFLDNLGLLTGVLMKKI
jgi:glycosyltransferase involved in cell wall biosynthesis